MFKKSAAKSAARTPRRLRKREARVILTRISLAASRAVVKLQRIARKLQLLLFDSAALEPTFLAISRIFPVPRVPQTVFESANSQQRIRRNGNHTCLENFDSDSRLSLLPTRSLDYHGRRSANLPPRALRTIVECGVSHCPRFYFHAFKKLPTPRRAAAYYPHPFPRPDILHCLVSVSFGIQSLFGL